MNWVLAASPRSLGTAEGVRCTTTCTAQVSPQVSVYPTHPAPCPLPFAGLRVPTELTVILGGAMSPSLPLPLSLYTLALYSSSSLRVPVLTQCPPDHSLPLRAVPSSGLISTTSPWMWPPDVSRHLKLSRSETTHFRVLQTAFVSWVSSPTWGRHPLLPQVSTSPGVLDRTGFSLHSSHLDSAPSPTGPAAHMGHDPFPLCRHCQGRPHPPAPESTSFPPASSAHLTLCALGVKCRPDPVAPLPKTSSCLPITSRLMSDILNAV